MSDIVTRARQMLSRLHLWNDELRDLACDAVDEIERLQAERALFVKLADAAAETCRHYREDMTNQDDDWFWGRDDIEKCLAALANYIDGTSK